MTEAQGNGNSGEVYWQVLRAIGTTAAAVGMLLLAAVTVATFAVVVGRAHQWGIAAAALLLVVTGTWGAFESILALCDVRRITESWERAVLQYALIVMIAANVVCVLATLVAVAGLFAAITGHSPLL